jgi:hypothetical protein
VPTWLVPHQERSGLEVFFSFGHPEKRYEICDNQAPCLPAFASPEESELRFGHFLEEICGREQTRLSRPKPTELGVEPAEVGRFRLARQGRQVCLDVAVDAGKYRELSCGWTKNEAWGWGATEEQLVRALASVKTSRRDSEAAGLPRGPLLMVAVGWAA